MAASADQAGSCVRRPATQLLCQNCTGFAGTLISHVEVVGSGSRRAMSACQQWDGPQRDLLFPDGTGRNLGCSSDSWRAQVTLPLPLWTGSHPTTSLAKAPRNALLLSLRPIRTGPAGGLPSIANDPAEKSGREEHRPVGIDRSSKFAVGQPVRRFENRSSASVSALPHES